MLPASLLLSVSYPPEYPDIAPGLDLSLAPSSLPPYHLTFPDDKAQLLDSIAANVEENLGMAMIFTLISTLKENTEQLIIERENAAQDLKDQESKRLEELENAKFHGEAVTKESFLAWREKFRAEMEEKRAKEETEREAEMTKKRLKVEEKLTGKELWEKGMVGKIEDGEIENTDEVDALERLKIIDKA